MTPMVSYLNDHGKLGVLLTGLVGAIVLRAIDAIDPATFAWMVGPIIGYVTGNGVLAKRGESPSPVIARPPELDEDEAS